MDETRILFLQKTSPIIDSLQGPLYASETD